MHNNAKAPALRHAAPDAHSPLATATTATTPTPVPASQPTMRKHPIVLSESESNDGSSEPAPANKKKSTKKKQKQKQTAARLTESKVEVSSTALSRQTSSQSLGGDASSKVEEEDLSDIEDKV
jgi:hypothetical protein